MFFHPPVFRNFQCETTENLDKSFNCFAQGEANEIFVNPKQEFSLFGRIFDECIWFSKSDISVLFRLARRDLSELELAAFQGDSSVLLTDFSLVRKQICELLLSSRSFIHRWNPELEEIEVYLYPYIKTIFKDIKRLKDLPDHIIFNKHLEDINQHASYNYIHLILDIQWLSLNMIPYLETDCVFKLEIFEKNIIIILEDLLNIFVRKLNKTNSYTNLSKFSPYICSCFKEILLLIQLHIEKLNSQKICEDFWHYFNIAIKNELNLGNCEDGKDSVICLWVLYHTACMQGYDSNGIYVGPQHLRVVSNYDLVEQCLRITTKNINIDEQLICSCLKLVANLQINWWKKDSSYNLLQLLWEYFYKKFNYSFSIEPDFHKFYDYNFLTESILEYDLEQLDTESSYNIFLSLLGKYLNLCPIHWPKLKGRIYSKLSPPKIAELTNTGLNNLIQLFFVLAYTVNFEELIDKLQKLLKQLPASKTDGNNIIWSAYISILIMKSNRGVNLNEDDTKTILLAVEIASNDRSQAHLMKMYIEGLKRIIETNQSFKCQAYVLFDKWIHRYLQWCQHSDACYLLNFFKNMVCNLDGNQEWWMVIEKYVVPSLIQLSSNFEAPFEVSELSAVLISSDCNRFKNLLEHFTGDAINVDLSRRFLTTFLEKNHVNIPANLQTLLIQSWVRIAILSTDKYQLISLTAQISQLSNWSSFYASIEENEDPLYGVIRSAGIQMRQSKTVQETAALKKWFETYFGRMDRWVGPVIAGAEKGENTHEILRVYTTAAILCLHCAPALYVKNKSTCILYRLISTLLLPPAILTNKKPPNLILSALKRTWHLFVRGIARLDYKSDSYIERSLKEICIRYIPYMCDNSSPIIRCLDNEFEDNATSFILDKISNILSCRSRNIHEHTLPALKLVLEMSQKRCESFNKFKIFMTILASLFEQLMFSEDITARNIVIEIIKKIKHNQNDEEKVREMIQSSILSIIDKHLAFHSINLFRLMEQLCSILANDVEDILPNFLEAIKKVEVMRGVGYDNTLRKGLETIKILINNQSGLV